MVARLVAVLLIGLPSLPVLGQVKEQANRLYEGVGLTPRLGNQVPLDLRFTGSEGQQVALSDIFGQERPVVLTFVYHTCPMLCSLLLDGVTRALADLPFTPGREYELITVSFGAADTPESAARQRERYMKQLDRSEAEWHFLTGSESAINSLTQSVGFAYKWVEEQQEYAHPAAVIFLSDSGSITRYLPDFAPQARDVRAAIVESSQGTVGTLLDRAFLFCFQFDPTSNSYVLVATRAMQVGGGLTALALLMSLGLLWMRELKRA